MKRKSHGWLPVLIFVFCLFIWPGTEQVHGAETVITDFSRIFYIPAGAVVKDGSLQELQEIYDSIGCTAYTEDGGELYLDVVWDYSGIDIQTVGAYKLTGTVKLPEGYVSKADVPVWTVAVSVQNQDQPEIQVYSRMSAAGIYYFPWIVETGTDTMEIWMKREGENWVNVSEEGYGFCDTDGMYLSCQSMVPDCTYTLTVTYDKGKTRNLTYRYGSDGTLHMISYQPGLLGEAAKKETVIRSCEPVDENNLERCMAYAVRTGQSLLEVQQDLENTFHILGSTCAEYQDTAAHPSVVMPSVWDFGQVNTAVPGVYQVTGQFIAPDGFSLEEGIQTPVATAYISVQYPDRPEIQTCYMAASDILFFPMILDSFTEGQLGEFQVYLKKNGKETKLEEEGFYFTQKGLYLRIKLLQMDQKYGIYVLYPGGTTGEYEFCWNQELITNEHWYERNYADRDGKEFPDIEAGSEKVTDVSTIIVGNRLADLISAGVKQIPFEKDGVLVKIPADVIEDWGVDEDDLVQVDIAREEEEISVTIFKNGEEITDIPGATVELPYNSGDGRETVLTDQEGEICQGSVNETQNVAVIPIDKTGSYSVKNQTDKEMQVQHKKSSIIVEIVAIMLILLWCVSARRGRKLRKGDCGEGEQGN